MVQVLVGKIRHLGLPVVHSGATVWVSETVTEAAAALSLQFGLEFRLVGKMCNRFQIKNSCNILTFSFMSDALSACFCPFPVHVLVSRLPDDPFSAEAKNCLPCRTERPDDAAGILNSPLHLVLLSLSIFSCSHWQQTVSWWIESRDRSACGPKLAVSYVHDPVLYDMKLQTTSVRLLCHDMINLLSMHAGFSDCCTFKNKTKLMCRCGLDRAEEEGFISERKKRVKAWLHVAKKDDNSL